MNLVADMREYGKHEPSMGKRLAASCSVLMDNVLSYCMDMRAFPNSFEQALPGVDELNNEQGCVHGLGRIYLLPWLCSSPLA